MIETKYGTSQGGWYTYFVGVTYGESMEIHKQEIVKIASFVTNELGTGETIQFWHDRWWGDETFKDQYPVGGQVCTSNRMLLSKGLF